MWTERKWGRDRAAHLLSLCDNSYIPMERVDQVLDGLLLGEARQVDVVFGVIAAGVERGAGGTQATCLGDIFLPQHQA